MTGLVGAVRFLTVLPVGPGEAEPEGGVGLRPADLEGRMDPRAASPDSGKDPGATTPWFPVVGALVGVLVIPGLWLGAATSPADALGPGTLLAAALTLALWTGLTGGLHEDGWADCADAAFAPVDRERRREILKDPLVGVHGASALFLLFLIRFSALVSFAALVPWAREVVLVIAAPVVGRWMMVLSLRGARSLNPQGLGSSFASAPQAGRASAAAMVLLAAIGGVAGLASVPALVAGAAGGLLAGIAVAGFLSRRFGGISGDGHGAAGIGAETVALVILALFLAGGAG
jgi:adenosylcobinamide-GDP ribazoletransferase